MYLEPEYMQVSKSLGANMMRQIYFSKLLKYNWLLNLGPSMYYVDKGVGEDQKTGIFASVWY